jgi:hypothetical protein
MPQKASVRGRREAFEARLLPPECRKSLWQTRYAEVKISGKHATAPRMPQNSGKGAARDLKPGYCLTLLSEGIRKALGKRPETRKRIPLRIHQKFKDRLMPPE